MNNRASLQLGGDNWASKNGNLLAYKASLSEKNFLPIEFDFTRGADIAATRINSSGSIEKYRENLLTYSNDFSGWSRVELNLNENQADPFGGNTSTLITTTGTTFGWIRQYPTNTGVQTISFYVKAGSNTKFTAGIVQSPYPQTTFTLTGNGAKSSNADVIDSTITSVGNGWYRCSMTYNFTSTYEIRFYPNDAINKTIGDSAYIYGFQLERGLVATSYLESGATTAKAGVLDNLPRINYSGSTASLLLEPGRTNEIVQSEYFDSWTKISSPTVTTNYGISPEGVQNSTRFQTSVGRLTNSVTTINANETFSVYMKGSGTLRMQIGDDNFYPSVTSEWVRYEFKTTQVGGISNVQIRGNGSAVDVELYGAQYERNSYPTSYIPTYGTIDERTRDILDRGSNLAYTGNYTLFMEFELTKDAVYLLTNTALAYRLFLEKDDAYFKFGSSNVFFQNMFDWEANLGTNIKMAIYKNGTSSKMFVNGTEYTPSLNALSTGDEVLDWRYLNYTTTADRQEQAYIKQLLEFEEALSDADCITLTTL